MNTNRFAPPGIVGAILVCMLVVHGCSMFTNKIKGVPETSAMIVIDCSVVYEQHIERDFAEFVKQHLFGQAKPDKNTLMGAIGVYIVGPGDKTVQGKKMAGDHFVFSDLRPGTYRLTRIKGSRSYSDDDRDEYFSGCPEEGDVFDKCPKGAEFEYVIPSQLEIATTRVVRAGDIVYMGKLMVNEYHLPPYGNRWSAPSSVQGQFDSYESHKHTDPNSFYLDTASQHETEALNNLLADQKDSPWTAQMKRRLDVLQSGEDVPAEAGQDTTKTTGPQ